MSAQSDEPNMSFMAKIFPTQVLDPFYTKEVCPVEFWNVPFPKKDCTKHAKDIPEEGLKELWMKLMNGDNYFIHVKETQVGMGVSWTIGVSMETVETDSNGDALLPPALEIELTGIDGSCRSLTMAISFSDPKLRAVVPDYLITNLGYRIVHFILRQQISQLRHLDARNTASLFKFLQSGYADPYQYHWWDMYDLSVLIARYALFGTSPPMLWPHAALDFVGKSLQAVKEWDRAAEMYLVASGWVSSGCSDDTGNILVSAGFAFQCGGKCADAEKQILRAFPFFLKEKTLALFDPNEESVSTQLYNLTYFYDHWHCSEHAREVVISEESQIYIALLALLYLAGWDGNGKPYKGQQYFDRGLLDSSINNKTKAKELLYLALMHEDAMTFRSNLLGARNPQIASVLVPDPNNPFDPNLFQEANKSTARKMLQDNPVSSNARCRMCSTMAEDMKFCPCHTVWYCGKECQLAHWNAGHKDVCPTTKKK